MLLASSGGLAPVRAVSPRGSRLPCHLTFVAVNRRRAWRVALTADDMRPSALYELSHTELDELLEEDCEVRMPPTHFKPALEWKSRGTIHNRAPKMVRIANRTVRLVVVSDSPLAAAAPGQGRRRAPYSACEHTSMPARRSFNVRGRARVLARMNEASASVHRCAARHMPCIVRMYKCRQRTT